MHAFQDRWILLPLTWPVLQYTCARVYVYYYIHASSMCLITAAYAQLQLHLHLWLPSDGGWGRLGAGDGLQLAVGLEYCRTGMCVDTVCVRRYYSNVCMWEELYSNECMWEELYSSIENMLEELYSNECMWEELYISNECMWEELYISNECT